MTTDETIGRPASRNDLFDLIRASNSSYSDEEGNDELPETCRRIEDILEASHHLLSEERSGNLPLHDAVIWSPLPIVELIYEAHPGAISEPNDNGVLPLHLACCTTHNPHFDRIARFLAQKHPEARTARANHSGQVPLHKLGLQPHDCSGAAADLLNVLTDGCEDETLLCEDVNKELPLHFFVRPANQKFGLSPSLESIRGALLRKILAHASELWSNGKKDEFVNLFEAVCFDPATVALFMDHWKGFPTHDLGWGRTPLHVVCSMGHFKGQFRAIRDLSAANPEVLTMHDVSEYEETPVHALARTKSSLLPSILGTLLKHNSNILRIPDGRGLVPFQVAGTEDCEVEVIYTLLKEAPEMVKVGPLTISTTNNEDNDGSDSPRKRKRLEFLF